MKTRSRSVVLAASAMLDHGEPAVVEAPAADYVRSGDGRLDLSVKKVAFVVFSSSGFDAHFDRIEMTLD